ncbi:MAG TPA: RecX family transcriptional regulator [Tepidisphaeraceae bacterium]|jgi:regulatory protein|nr:RecX family transcriptional regulator [Tepidisphaeraceae bacterium]
MPVITQISEQKRRQNRRNIYLDGAFAFGVNLNVVATFRLREGLSLSAEQVAEIERGEVRQECFDRAIRLLEGRLHSRAELKKKLGRHEYGDAVIEGVLTDLERLNYIDDARFAKSKATTTAQYKHHGKRRAMQELMRAGVKGSVAKAALDEVYDATDPVAEARALAEKQAARLSRLDPIVAKRRLVGMLQRRGFDYEAIKPVVDAVLGGRSGDD